MDMSDVEITKRCAEAMGYKIDDGPYNGGGIGNTGFDSSGRAVLDWHNGITYDPLTDDAQAMALVKKFPLDISRFMNGIPPAGDSRVGFEVSHWDGGRVSVRVEGDNLNRAICECVAKMNDGH